MMHLAEFYSEAASATPDKAYFVVDDDILTYADLHRTTLGYSRALLSLGVESGDRVAFFMDNRVQVAPLYFACFRCGAVAIPLSSYSSPHEAAYAINDCGAAVLVVEAQKADSIPAIREQAPGLEHCLVVGEVEGSGGDAPSFDELVAASSGRDAPLAQREERAPAVVIYTSGSTGRPKGVTHTFHSLGHCAQSRIAALRHDASHVFLTPAKFCHGAGLTSQLLPLALVGGAIVTTRQQLPSTVHQLMRRWRPTFLNTSPGLLRQALDDPSFDKELYAGLQALYVGGDKASADLYDYFREKTGMELREAMGMTEAGGFLNCPPDMKPKPNSAGKPVPGAELRIVDQDGSDVPAGKEGELIVRTEALMSGYWGKPELTRKAIRDGWLWTGDLARVDEDGYYFITGRIKDVIVHNVGNVEPAEVEDALNQHPQVTDCSVFGVPAADVGEVVYAAIVPKNPAAPPSVEELDAFARKTLSVRKIPEGWLFLDSIPLTQGMAKVDRKSLRAMAEAKGRSNAQQ